MEIVIVSQTDEYKQFTRNSLISQNLDYSDLMETVGYVDENYLFWNNPIRRLSRIGAREKPDLKDVNAKFKTQKSGGKRKRSQESSMHWIVCSGKNKMNGRGEDYNFKNAQNCFHQLGWSYTIMKTSSLLQKRMKNLEKRKEMLKEIGSN